MHKRTDRLLQPMIFVGHTPLHSFQLHALVGANIDVYGRRLPERPAMVMMRIQMEKIMVVRAMRRLPLEMKTRMEQ